MEHFVFHRDDLVPEDIDNEEKVKKYKQESEKPLFNIRDKVRNINNLDIVMIINRKIREDGKLVGFQCYWWE